MGKTHRSCQRTYHLIFATRGLAFVILSSYSGTRGRKLLEESVDEIDPHGEVVPGILSSQKAVIQCREDASLVEHMASMNSSRLEPELLEVVDWADAVR
jgi:hypothetical protein